jgi:DNA replicative helicase MCM subunit Mcm2 (Cdc46/Mcm family)
MRRQSWSLIKEESTFIDWQRAKVQESTDEVGSSGRHPCLLI